MTGRVFVLPWVIGFLLFFLVPVIVSIKYSFAEISIGSNGLDELFIGFKNFIEAFTKDTTFPIILYRSLINLYQLPIVIVFALFIAIFLNQEFKGRIIARVVFFLPVIITSGVIIFLLRTDSFGNIIAQGDAQAMASFQNIGLQKVLLDAKLPIGIVSFFTMAVSDILNLAWKSGVQILLFLAGLKTVSSSLYEAATVEGASGWMCFWKITLPVISPVILANSIYTIIDSFTDYNNDVIRTINEYAFKNLRYGYACATAWIYFVLIAVILVIVYLLVFKKVFYMSN
jgi:ABC-type sugar transport system permease subunit